jgi:hypothetical protein
MLTLAALTLLTPRAEAARIKVVEGDLAGLAQHERIYVEYDYSDLMIGKKRDKLTDAAYIERKVEEKEQDEPGSGMSWKERWLGDREAVYHPKMKALFDKYAEKTDTELTFDETKGDIRMHVDVTWLEPGWYAGIMEKEAEADMTLTLTSMDGSETYAVVEVSGAVGDVRPAVADRVGEAYAWTGKYFGKLFKKAAK